MFNMFKQLFMAITVLFQAAEKGAKAIDHLATWSEETAASFADEARSERAQKKMQLEAKLKAVEKKTIAA